MARRILWMGFLLGICLSLFACSPKPTPVGWWWVEMTFSCADGSGIHAIVPFEVVQDGTFTGNGTFQGSISVPPPRPCSTLSTVNIEGTVSLAGNYDDSGVGGLVLDQLHLGGKSSSDATCL